MDWFCTGRLVDAVGEKSCVNMKAVAFLSRAIGAMSSGDQEVLVTNLLAAASSALKDGGSAIDNLFPVYSQIDAAIIVAPAFAPAEFADDPAVAREAAKYAMDFNHRAYTPMGRVSTTQFNRLAKGFNRGGSNAATMFALDRAVRMADDIRRGLVHASEVEPRQVRRLRHQASLARAELISGLETESNERTPLVSFFNEVVLYFQGKVEVLGVPATMCFYDWVSGVEQRVRGALTGLFGPFAPLLETILTSCRAGFARFYSTLAVAFAWVRGRFEEVEGVIHGHLSGGTLIVTGLNARERVLQMLSELVPVGERVDRAGVVFVPHSEEGGYMPASLAAVKASDYVELAPEAFDFRTLNAMDGALRAVMSIARALYQVVVGMGVAAGLWESQTAVAEGILTKVTSEVLSPSASLADMLLYEGRLTSALRAAHQANYSGPLYGTAQRCLARLESSLVEKRIAVVEISKTEAVFVYVYGDPGAGKDLLANMLLSNCRSPVTGKKMDVWVGGSPTSGLDNGHSGQEGLYWQDFGQCTIGAERTSEVMRAILFSSSAPYGGNPPFGLKGLGIAPRVIVATSNAAPQSLSANVTSIKALHRRITLEIEVKKVDAEPIYTIRAVRNAGTVFDLGVDPESLIDRPISSKALVTLVERSMAYKKATFERITSREPSGDDLPPLAPGAPLGRGVPHPGLQPEALPRPMWLAGMVAAVAGVGAATYLLARRTATLLDRLEATATVALRMLTAVESSAGGLIEWLGKAAAHVRAIMVFAWECLKVAPERLSAFVSRHYAVICVVALALRCLYLQFRPTPSAFTPEAQYWYSAQNASGPTAGRTIQHVWHVMAARARAKVSQLRHGSFQPESGVPFPPVAQSVVPITLDFVLSSGAGTSADQYAVCFGRGWFLTTAHAFPEHDVVGNITLMCRGKPTTVDARYIDFFFASPESDNSDLVAFHLPETIDLGVPSALSHFATLSSAYVGSATVVAPSGLRPAGVATEMGRINYGSMPSGVPYTAGMAIKTGYPSSPGDCGLPLVVNGKIVGLHVLGSGTRLPNKTSVAVAIPQEFLRELVEGRPFEDVAAVVPELQPESSSNPYFPGAPVREYVGGRVKTFSGTTNLTVHANSPLGVEYADDCGIPTKRPGVYNALELRLSRGADFVPKVQDNSSKGLRGTELGQVTEILLSREFAALSASYGGPFPSRSMAEVALTVNKDASPGAPYCLSANGGRTLRKLSELTYRSDDGRLGWTSFAEVQIEELRTAIWIQGTQALQDKVRLLAKIKDELLRLGKVPRIILVCPFTLIACQKMAFGSFVEHWMRHGEGHFVGRDPTSLAWHELWTHFREMGVPPSQVFDIDFKKFDFSQPGPVWKVMAANVQRVCQDPTAEACFGCGPYLPVISDDSSGPKIFDRGQGNATGQYATTSGNTLVAKSAVYTGLVVILGRRRPGRALQALVQEVDASVVYMGYGDDALLGLRADGAFAGERDTLLDELATAIGETSGMVVTPGNKGDEDVYHNVMDVLLPNECGLPPLHGVSFLKRRPVRITPAEIMASCPSLAPSFPSGVYGSALDLSSIIGTVSHVLKNDNVRIATSSRVISALMESVAYGELVFKKVLEIAQGPFSYAGSSLPLLDGAGRPIYWPTYAQMRRSYVTRACTKRDFVIELEETDYSDVIVRVEVDDSLFM